MTRREMLGLLGVLSLAADSALRNIGGAPAGFPVRIRAARASGKALDFLDHCHLLGLGVAEVR